MPRMRMAIAFVLFALFLCSFVSFVRAEEPGLQISYYELLEVSPSADALTLKKASVTVQLA
jgi:hypothetical protein